MFIAKARERGDTIVEVLIAIAVVSMVLGGAYVTTNQSLQSSRTTEEQTNGVKLAESQIEQLKGLAVQDPDQIFGTGTPASFCVYHAAVFDASNAKCKVDIGGEPTTAQPQFAISTTRSSDTFTVSITWDKVGSGDQNNTKMVYRLHE